MEKYCAKSKNLINLKKLYSKKQLFANILTTKVFNTILEIFKNAVGRFFTDCFSTKTRKKCKKHKTLLRNILNENLDLNKRKKKFKNSNKQFKCLVTKNIIPEFWKNCVKNCK